MSSPIIEITIFFAGLFAGYIISTLVAWKLLASSFLKVCLYIFVYLLIFHGIDGLIRGLLQLEAPKSFIGFPLSILIGTVIFNGVFSKGFGKSLLVVIIVSVIWFITLTLVSTIGIISLMR